MDAGKEIIFEAKRAKRAEQVLIEFPTKDNNFVVVDEEGRAKYNGIVQGPEPHKDDYCSCKNFEALNHERHMATHGVAYQCKHLIKARILKFEVFP